MNLHSPEGERYLETVRACVRAVVEYRIYGGTEAAALSLGITVAALEEYTDSAYGRAFAEWTYGPARAHLRHAYTHELTAFGMTIDGICRVFGDVTVREVERWLAKELPPEPVAPEPTRYTGKRCRRCGMAERYSGSNRCVGCNYAAVCRWRETTRARPGIRA